MRRSRGVRLDRALLIGMMSGISGVQGKGDQSILALSSRGRGHVGKFDDSCPGLFCSFARLASSVTSTVNDFRITV